jgi:hypothetical protein
VTIDELMRPAAANLHEQIAQGVDIDDAYRAVLERSTPQRTARRRRSPALAFAAFGLVIVVIVAGILVVVLTRSDSHPPASRPALRDAPGLVVTAIPRGFQVTQVLTPPRQQGTNACCSSRTVIFGRVKTDGSIGAPVLIRVVRNPLNGVLTDQDPSTVAETTDPTARLRWTKAPDWEFQLQSTLPRDELNAFAAGVVIPTDSQATVDDVTFTQVPVSSNRVFDSTAPATTGLRELLTYSDQYGSTPSLQVQVSNSGPLVFDATKVRLTKVQGKPAYVTTGREANGNIVRSVQWHTDAGDIAVRGTGLSERQVLAAAESIRGVDAVHWHKLTGAARVPAELTNDPTISLFLGGTRASGPGIENLSTLARPEGTYRLRLGHLTDDSGTSWLCVTLVREISPTSTSGDGQCTDPQTGFATPYLSGSLGQPQLFLASYPSKVKTVDLRLPDRTIVHTTAAPAGSKHEPRTFYAVLDPNQSSATIIARDASGATVEQAHVGQ